MAIKQTAVITRPLRTLWSNGVFGDLPDKQLLDRFEASHPETAEAAFDALVHRHGPMVLRICREILADAHDADDAFQATFLVLIRRASLIRDRDSLASWLYGVATRVALRARTDLARRREVEHRGAALVKDRARAVEQSFVDPVIHEELMRLSDKYRAPIVLCYLEGLTHEGAAQQLGWPVGTVRGRLARARDLLRNRLTRRGVTASAALAGVGSLPGAARAAVPTGLRDATVRSAIRVASGQSIASVSASHVASWAEAASTLVGLSRWKPVAGLMLCLGVIGIGLAFAMAGAHPLEQKLHDQPPTTPVYREDRSANLRAMLQLKGTWASPQTVTYNIGGVPQPPKPYKLIYSIERDTITTSDPDGFASWTYRYSLDPDQTPKRIELRSLNNGVVLHGIYKLEGDTLTICHGLQRPMEFRKGPSQFLIVFHRESRTPANLAPEVANAPGCYWICEPKGAAPSSMTNGIISFNVKKDPQGAMLVTLAFIAKLEGGEPDVEYRPVAVDGKKARYLFEGLEGGWGGSAPFPNVVLGMKEYRLDPEILPFDRVRSLGVEVVPAEVRREAKAAASARAIQEARGAGIEILPRPEVGKPYEFALTAADGQELRSGALKGKVVLIDCWASWSGPCTAKMPGLKQLYERRRGDGFEVIGLNFDQDRTRAERLIKTQGLPWHQVFVPGDDRTRRLWDEGPGLPSYTRLLLIDRDGVLRWDGDPGELDERVAELLARPATGK